MAASSHRDVVGVFAHFLWGFVKKKLESVATYNTQIIGRICATCYRVFVYKKDIKLSLNVLLNLVDELTNSIIS